MSTADPRHGFTPSVRAAVIHANALCAYCDSDEPTEIDHIIPWSRGGSNDLENLAPACSRCNLEKSDRTPDEWQADRKLAGQPWPIPNFTTRFGRIAELLHNLPEAELKPLADSLAGDSRAAKSYLERLIRAGRAGEELPQPPATLLRPIGGAQE